MRCTDERFRLKIPVEEALAFALGRSNLGYPEASDAARCVMGVLAIDSLEYSEQWRAAAEARARLRARWPEQFGPEF
ncbi:MAG TPA: hypothetical protein VK474_06175 [Chthoniobacterales bacterium]|nr:hypothetical protein [Chthoniobacterales bacterium]